MAYTLPDLPYAYDALEPHIDARTMEIHHSKHHNTYITNLNKALEGAGITGPECVCDLVDDLSQVPESIRMAVRNNGGGHANHSFFWKLLSPEGGGEPTGALAEAINKTFGSFTDFQEKFTQAALTRFGSGWAWLCVTEDKSLCVCSSPNQDCPAMKGVTESWGMPILGLDVWEHAYYLNYQNRRPDYVKGFWNVVNWTYVQECYDKAMS
tara:strand:- start:11486 stop:12115 length:630 start_codon:yes stop_codon:yes gene_type:complete